MPNEEEKHELIEFIDNYKESGKYKKKESELYVGKENKEYEFIPLKNEDGFIVYSKEKIADLGNYDAKFKESYEKCKDLKKIEKAGETYIHRYYYYQKIDDKNKNTLTIIMLNPAFAYSEKEDHTIKNIEAIIEKNGKYGSFEIINLYSVRMSKPKNVEDLLTSVGNTENLKFIKKYIENKTNDILLAYGGKYSLSKNDKKNIEEFLKELSNKKNLYAIRINNSGTPMHPSPQTKQYLKNFEKLIPILLKQSTFKVEENSQK